jgi:hypothetical protein
MTIAMLMANTVKAATQSLSTVIPSEVEYGAAGEAAT